jgi:hypothetical protein
MSSLFVTVPGCVFLATWLVCFQMSRFREGREYLAEVEAWRAELHARHAIPEPPKEIDR